MWFPRRVHHPVTITDCFTNWTLISTANPQNRKEKKWWWRRDVKCPLLTSELGILETQFTRINNEVMARRALWSIWTENSAGSLSRVSSSNAAWITTKRPSSRYWFFLNLWGGEMRAGDHILFNGFHFWLFWLARNGKLKFKKLR